MYIFIFIFVIVTSNYSSFFMDENGITINQ